MFVQLPHLVLLDVLEILHTLSGAAAGSVRLRLAGLHFLGFVFLALSSSGPGWSGVLVDNFELVL